MCLTLSPVKELIVHRTTQTQRVLLFTEIKCWVSIDSIIDSDWDQLPDFESFTPAPPPIWHLEASCKDIKEDKKDETFFGEKDSTVRPAMNMKQIKKAKDICRTCPVITECLAFALSSKEGYGVWGGTSGRTRQKIWSGIEAGVFTLEIVLEDYVVWNIKKYETYKDLSNGN